MQFYLEIVRPEHSFLLKNVLLQILGEAMTIRTVDAPLRSSLSTVAPRLAQRLSDAVLPSLRSGPSSYFGCSNAQMHYFSIGATVIVPVKAISNLTSNSSDIRHNRLDVFGK